MKKTILQWIAVYLLPYIAIVAITLSQGKGLGGEILDDIRTILASIFVPMFAPPLLAILGYGIGFSASSASTSFYTIEFKLALMAFIIVSLGLFTFGIKKRDKLWGKIINATGFYVFCMGGLISLAPSA